MSWFRSAFPLLRRVLLAGCHYLAVGLAEEVLIYHESGGALTPPHFTIAVLEYRGPSSLHRGNFVGHVSRRLGRGQASFSGSVHCSAVKRSCTMKEITKTSQLLASNGQNAAGRFDVVVDEDSWMLP
jgi:hypothetical protein